MSVKLILDEYKTMGTLQITDENDTSCGYDYVLHIRAIISFIKAADLDLIDKDDLYNIMCILENYMPNEDQADRMLKPSPH